MNSTTTDKDLSCFRIVCDDRDGAFFIHAYSASSQCVVEVSTHWDRAAAEMDLAQRLIGRGVRVLCTPHTELLSMIGKVISVTAKEVRVEFATKVYSCHTGWFSQTFQSIL